MAGWGWFRAQLRRPPAQWIPTAPNNDRRGVITWAELEVPDEPRRGVVTWAELEVPDEPRRGVVTWAEMEVPDEPRRGVVTWAEFEVPLAPARGVVTWAELEVPDEPRRGVVTWAELEVPNEPRRGVVTWAEFEVPIEPRRGIVTWAEFEVPDPLTTDRRGIITWAEFEVPDLPTTSGGGRHPQPRIRITLALRFETPTLIEAHAPKRRPFVVIVGRATVARATLSIPSPPIPPAIIVTGMAFGAARPLRIGSVGRVQLAVPSAPFAAVTEMIFAAPEPVSPVLAGLRFEVPDEDDLDLLIVAGLLA